MKTLSNYISEKLIINKDYDSGDNFIYKINKRSRIKIFHYMWYHFQKFKNNVYINGKHIELDSYGWTKDKYEQGTYKVYIEDLNYINNSNTINSCANMFNECLHLVEVPLFDTSNIKWMDKMFYRCSNLEKIPKFDTSNVEYMGSMFFYCTKLKDVPLFNTNSIKYMEKMFKKCDNLNNETKKAWSKIYDFDLDDKK